MEAHEESFSIDPDDKSYLCSDCGKELKSKSGYRRHRMKHNSQERFSCDHCDAKFMERHHYEGHLRAHNGTNLKCDTCDKEFRHKESLKRHLKSCVNPTLKEYGDFKCDQCEKIFTRKDELKDHQNGIHRCIYQYSCKVCGQNYRWRSSLSVHTKTAHN